MLGIDSSEKMVKTAIQNSAGMHIDYRNLDIENLKQIQGQFDIVLSSLTLHYVKDIVKYFRMYTLF